MVFNSNQEYLKTLLRHDRNQTRGHLNIISDGLREMNEVVFSNQILRGVVGSTAHGLAVEGQDDRDEMGVFIEPPEYVCGLKSLDHYIYRDKAEGVRSEAGDLDLTMYSLRKFCRLAAQGNPTVLILLYLEEYVTDIPLGWQLVANSGMFFSRQVGYRFLGYLNSQKRALTGEKTKAVTRPELVEQYGYDTKFAMHALRLAYQGVEYLSNHRLLLPIPEPQRSTLRAVRLGNLHLKEVLSRIDDAEKQLQQLVTRCEIQQPDYKRINRFLIHTHKLHWKGYPKSDFTG